MRIGEAAAAVGVTPRALRYYEQRGLLAARRGPSGHREYGQEDIRLLLTLRHLMDSGLTISDVQSLAGLLAGPALGDDDPGGGTAPRRCGGPDPERGPDPGAAAAWEGGVHESFVSVTLRRLAGLDQRIERLTEIRDRLAHSLDQCSARRSEGRAPGDEGS
ncbi:MerR family transcriptional regulator [Streptomyces yaizuensis]|uniref:MerR family transcriptional regulator n=1 Tax=Streptomyces yaizuensis TaxID=2989713 RepID=A0ABQ5NRK3_9ACTN|nr:MerR family transcriptional regulator [Streptomyces sp. YSPA8]GLF92902.1 MerR family transcriptional regulator [Streptomyces sp. YSPA8]